MSLLTMPDAPRSTASQRPAAVRVDGGDGSQRILPLAIGKTTIGSSPQCVVCLPPSDARPLQCLVTATAEQVEATRWGAGALLNGREFTRSAVHAGDRLSIGCSQIEFLGDEAFDAPTPATEQVSWDAVTVEAPAVPEPAVASTPEALPTASAAITRGGLPEVEVPQSATSLEEEALEDSAPFEEEVKRTEQVVATPSPVVAPAIEPQLPATSTPTIVLSATPTVAFTPVTEPTIPPVSEPTIIAGTSQSFADRLIVDLWQAAYNARRRASALIRGVRDARFHADAMAADLSAMECELDLARAAYDSSAHDHQQLHMELLEHDRQAAERVAPLQAEIDALRSQLQESQTELAEQAAHCEELDATLAIAIAAQSVPAAASPNVDATRVTELEQSLAVQIDQAGWLAQELGALRTEIERTRNELHEESARNRELQEALEAAQATGSAFDQTKLDLQDRDQTIAALKSELASRDAQLSELSNQLAAAEQKQLPAVDDMWTPKAQVAASIEPTEEPQFAGPISAGSTAWPTSPAETASAWAVALPAEEKSDAVEAPKKQPAPEPSPLFAPAAASPAPVAAPEKASTSFIDKYRHLLDDDGDSSPSEQAAPMRIDDEFLSPAKAAQHVSPADDSDDALEAYMAGMMQRVRGASNGPAHLAPAVEPAVPTAILSRSVPAAEETPADEEAADVEPFDIEKMKQGRRPAASTDLSAMREIANSSARSAIAKHHKRRSAESTVGKVIVAVIALATASGLMSKASSLRDWEFLVGAGFGLIGFAMVAFIVRVAGRAASDKRAATRASAAASAEPTPEA